MADVVDARVTVDPEVAHDHQHLVTDATEIETANKTGRIKTVKPIWTNHQAENARVPGQDPVHVHVATTVVDVTIPDPNLVLDQDQDDETQKADRQVEPRKTDHEVDQLRLVAK